MECRTLSGRQAKACYNRVGKKQDRKRFYEDIATEALIRNGEFDEARTVFECGFGAGRRACCALPGNLGPGFWRDCPGFRTNR